MAIHRKHFYVILFLSAVLVLTVVQFSQHQPSLLTAYNKLVGPPAEPKLGYIVTLTTSGQQASGIRALKSLQCWASTLPLPVKILEPVFYNSTIISLPTAGPETIRPNLTHVMFGDVFDLDEFNKKAEQEHLPQFATAKEFHERAAKKTVLLLINIHVTEQKSRVIWPDRGSKTGNCLNFEEAQDKLREYAN